MNIDTHALVKALERVNFKEEQAEVIVDVVKQLQTQNNERINEIATNTKEKLEGVATKEFVRTEINATKEFVRAEIETVRTEIKSQYIKFTGLVFTMLIALKVLTPYLDKFI